MKKTRQWDPWDLLCILSVLLVAAGIECIYWPAAPIILGLAGLAAYAIREWSSVVDKIKGTNR